MPGAYLTPLLRFPHAETSLHFAGCALIVASAALFCRHPAELAGIALISAVVASALELFQLLVPERGLSLSDAAANAGGAAAGYLIAWIAGRLARLRTDRPKSQAD